MDVDDFGFDLEIGLKVCCMDFIEKNFEVWGEVFLWGFLFIDIVLLIVIVGILVCVDDKVFCFWGSYGVDEGKNFVFGWVIY